MIWTGRTDIPVRPTIASFRPTPYFTSSLLGFLLFTFYSSLFTLYSLLFTLRYPPHICSSLFTFRYFPPIFLKNFSHSKITFARKNPKTRKKHPVFPSKHLDFPSENHRNPTKTTHPITINDNFSPSQSLIYNFS